MTICLYSDRTLYADRAGVVFNTPFRFTDLSKLYVDASKTFAIASAGKEFEVNSSYRVNMAKLYLCLKLAEVSDSSIEVSDTNLGPLLGSRPCIVVTRNRVYTKMSRGDLYTIDSGHPCAIGSGSSYAIIALQAGKSPLEAMRISSLTDPASHLTEIDSVKMSDLKPFPKPEIKK